MAPCNVFIRTKSQIGVCDSLSAPDITFADLQKKKKEEKLSHFNNANQGGVCV